MIGTKARPQDPLRLQILLTLGFALLVFWHLATPAKLFFDEIHYIPAARAMLQGLPANPEHPLFAKSLMALSIRLLGDTPMAWRLPSAVMGCMGLLAFGRCLWWITGRPVAALAGMVLLASDFAWFVQSRIAMLDMVMAGFAMLALALWSGAAMDSTAHPARRILWLALGGVGFGLALGAKWSALPLWALAAFALLALRLLRPDKLNRLGWGPVLFYTIALPLIAYWLTFWPAFHHAHDAISPWDPLGWHRTMLDLQEGVIKHHPYQSVWSQWIINWRAIWYLYEFTEGAQRGVVLLGNPFSMLAGLVALVWCSWVAYAQRRVDAALVLAAYLASLGLWVVAAKPVQFYYHYLLPGTCLMAALALAVDGLWQAGQRWRREAAGIVLLSIGVMVWFYPILSAAPLSHGARSFEQWMWLDSWR
ncbi:phospholipid carrier-dependent glycosyltransferase [Novosphingobium umbonatum]|uniref:Polyprenol-phosphate-mannose--protein mannosyltransferase n=1 Tax=Novosphingobium umbonatum TaxID=1908524 RepID=A0A3S2Y780_9SPHN|nr:phospholipid carrier-dependent glycosyltransferase [Novosphingobium umbonatum]RVU03858.1 phospholipid carrier-dependent glycosyltransferase [Novosphingobium umbonatum]